MNYIRSALIQRMTEPWQHHSAWWRHQMEIFSTLLAICAGNSPFPGEFPAQRPVTRSFDVFFYLRPNKRLSTQWWGWWFETPTSPLWRHFNEALLQEYQHVCTLRLCCPDTLAEYGPHDVRSKLRTHKINTMPNICMKAVRFQQNLRCEKDVNTFHCLYYIIIQIPSRTAHLPKTCIVISKEPYQSYI